MLKEYCGVLFNLAIMIMGIYVLVNCVLSFFLDKEKRKKVFDAIKLVLTIIMIPTSLFSIVFSVLTESRIVNRSIWTFAFSNEIFCYVIMSVTYLLVYSMLIKGKKIRTRIINGSLGATIYTVEVFIVNNMLHIALLWNIWDRKWLEIIQLLRNFMIYDISYKRGLGIYRYILVFIVQLTLFSLIALAESEKIKDKCLNIYKKTKEKLIIAIRLSFKKSGLIQLSDLYADGSITFTAIDEYLCKSQYDTYMKHDLMYCIKRYRIPLYSDLLFSLFGETLSKEQYINYREIFIEGNSCNLCTACKTLDEKYGIKYSATYRETSIEKYKQAAQKNKSTCDRKTLIKEQKYEDISFI